MRAVACGLVFSFLCGDLAQAAPAAVSPSVSSVTSLSADPTRFEPPLPFASLREIHRGSGPFVIHIQDAHSNLSGQENLAWALDAIMEKYAVRLVLVEGGSRDATLTPIKAIASPETWKRVAKRFLVEGKISGEEYLNLISEKPMKIVGVEDSALYVKSVESYAALAAVRPQALEYLARVRAALETLKRRRYAPELRAYEERLGRAGTETDYRATLELARAAGIDVSANRTLALLDEIESREKTIDFERANLEQAALVEEIARRGGSDRLRRTFEAARRAQDGAISRYPHFRNTFLIAREKGVDTSRYPALGAYVEYLRLFSEIDVDALLRECEAVREASYAKFLRDDASRKLRAIDRYASLLDTAFRIRMSAEEFETLRMNEPDFTTAEYLAFVNRLLSESGAFESLVPHTDALERASAPLKAFYDSVRERDFAFVRNAAAALERERESVAVLITGGYHTPHLKKLMREQGFSYAVLTPAVTAETNQAKYEDLLLAPLRKKAAAAGVSLPAGGYETARKMPAAEFDWIYQIIQEAKEVEATRFPGNAAGIEERAAQAAIDHATRSRQPDNDPRAAAARLADEWKPFVVPGLPGRELVLLSNRAKFQLRMDVWEDPRHEEEGRQPVMSVYAAADASAGSPVYGLRGFLIRPFLDDGTPLRGTGLFRGLLDRYFAEYPQVTRTHPDMRNLIAMDVLLRDYGFRPPAGAAPNAYLSGSVFYMNAATRALFQQTLSVQERGTFTDANVKTVPDAELAEIAGLNGTRPLYVGQILERVPAAGARLAEGAAAEALGRLRAAFEDPRPVSWAVNGKPVSASIEYDRAFDVYVVTPSAETRAAYPELAALDTRSSQEDIGPSGSFGQIAVRIETVDGRPAAIFDEMHPSFGYRLVRPTRVRNVVRPWIENAAAAMTAELRAAGIDVFYASTPERIRRRYPNVPAVNLWENYEFAFSRKGWERVTVSLEGEEGAELWRLSSGARLPEVKDSMEVLGSPFSRELASAGDAPGAYHWRPNALEDVRTALDRLPEFLKTGLLEPEMPGIVVHRYRLSSLEDSIVIMGFKTLSFSGPRSLAVTEIQLYDMPRHIGRDSFFRAVLLPTFNYDRILKRTKNYSRRTEKRIKDFRLREAALKAEIDKTPDALLTELSVLHETGEALLELTPLAAEWQALFRMDRFPEADMIGLRNLIYAGEDPKEFASETFADKFAVWILAGTYPQLARLGWSISEEEARFMERFAAYLLARRESGRWIHEISPFFHFSMAETPRAAEAVQKALEARTGTPLDASVFTRLVAAVRSKEMEWDSDSFAAFLSGKIDAAVDEAAFREADAAVRAAAKVPSGARLAAPATLETVGGRIGRGGYASAYWAGTAVALLPNDWYRVEEDGKVVFDESAAGRPDTASIEDLYHSVNALRGVIGQAAVLERLNPDGARRDLPRLVRAPADSADLASELESLYGLFGEPSSPENDGAIRAALRGFTARLRAREEPLALVLQPFGTREELERLEMLSIDDFELARRIPQWPVESRLHLFKTLGRTLRYVHSKDVAHRDVKPSNFWFPPSYFGDRAPTPAEIDARPPLLHDFGLAWMEGDPLSLAALRAERRRGTPGTPLYMPMSAAVRAEKEPADPYDRDLFALGASMAELSQANLGIAFERAFTMGEASIDAKLALEKPEEERPKYLASVVYGPHQRIVDRTALRLSRFPGEAALGGVIGRLLRHDLKEIAGRRQELFDAIEALAPADAPPVVSGARASGEPENGETAPAVPAAEEVEDRWVDIWERNLMQNRQGSFTDYPPAVENFLEKSIRDYWGDGAGRRLADIGAGADLFLSRVFGIRFPQASFSAVDIFDMEPGMLAGTSRLDYRRGTAERTGFSDGELDAALYSFSFDYADREGAAAELARILKPGGRAFLALHNPGSAFVREASRSVEGLAAAEEFLDSLKGMIERGETAEAKRAVLERRTVVLPSERQAALEFVETERRKARVDAAIFSAMRANLFASEADASAFFAARGFRVLAAETLETEGGPAAYGLVLEKSATASSGARLSRENLSSGAEIVAPVPTADFATRTEIRKDARGGYAFRVDPSAYILESTGLDAAAASFAPALTPQYLASRYPELSDPAVRRRLLPVLVPLPANPFLAVIERLLRSVRLSMYRLDDAIAARNVLAVVAAKALANPGRTVRVLDWGAGMGTASVEMSRALRGAGVGNVEIYAYGNMYFEEWRRAPEPVVFVYDTADELANRLAERGAAGNIDLVFSHSGMIHLKGELAPHLDLLHGLLAPGGTIVSSGYMPASDRKSYRAARVTRNYEVRIAEGAARGSATGNLPHAILLEKRSSGARVAGEEPENRPAENSNFTTLSGSRSAGEGNPYVGTGNIARDFTREDEITEGAMDASIRRILERKKTADVWILGAGLGASVAELRERYGSRVNLRFVNKERLSIDEEKYRETIAGGPLEPKAARWLAPEFREWFDKKAVIADLNDGVPIPGRADLILIGTSVLPYIRKKLELIAEIKNEKLRRGGELFVQNGLEDVVIEGWASGPSTGVGILLHRLNARNELREYEWAVDPISFDDSIRLRITNHYPRSKFPVLELISSRERIQTSSSDSGEILPLPPRYRSFYRPPSDDPSGLSSSSGARLGDEGRARPAFTRAWRWIYDRYLFYRIGTERVRRSITGLPLSEAGTPERAAEVVRNAVDGMPFGPGYYAVAEPKPLIGLVRFRIYKKSGWSRRPGDQLAAAFSLRHSLENGKLVVEPGMTVYPPQQGAGLSARFHEVIARIYPRGTEYRALIANFRTLAALAESLPEDRRTPLVRRILADWNALAVKNIVDDPDFGFFDSPDENETDEQFIERSAEGPLNRMWQARQWALSRELVRISAASAEPLWSSETLRGTVLGRLAARVGRDQEILDEDSEVFLTLRTEIGSKTDAAGGRLASKVEGPGPAADYLRGVLAEIAAPAGRLEVKISSPALPSAAADSRAPILRAALKELIEKSLQDSHAPVTVEWGADARGPVLVVRRFNDDMNDWYFTAERLKRRFHVAGGFTGRAQSHSLESGWEHAYSVRFPADATIRIRRWDTAGRIASASARYSAGSAKSALTMVKRMYAFDFGRLNAHLQSLALDAPSGAALVIGPYDNAEDILALLRENPGVKQVHVVDPAEEAFDLLDRRLHAAGFRGEVSGYRTSVLTLPRLEKIGMVFAKYVFSPGWFDEGQYRRAGEQISRVLEEGGIHVEAGGADRYPGYDPDLPMRREEDGPDFSLYVKTSAPIASAGARAGRAPLPVEIRDLLFADPSVAAFARTYPRFAEGITDHLMSFDGQTLDEYRAWVRRGEAPTLSVLDGRFRRGLREMEEALSKDVLSLADPRFFDTETDWREQITLFFRRNGLDEKAPLFTAAAALLTLSEKNPRAAADSRMAGIVLDSVGGENLLRAYVAAKDATLAEFLLGALESEASGARLAGSEERSDGVPARPVILTLEDAETQLARLRTAEPELFKDFIVTVFEDPHHSFVDDPVKQALDSYGLLRYGTIRPETLSAIFRMDDADMPPGLAGARMSDDSLELLWILNTKHDFKALARGGPIGSPEFFALEPDPEAALRLGGPSRRAKEFRPLLAVDTQDFAAVIRGIADGRLPAMVYKPDSLSIGKGVFFVERRAEGGVWLTFSADPATAQTEAAQYLERRGVLLLAGADVYRAAVDESHGIEETLSGFRERVSFDRYRDSLVYYPGMMERMVDAIKVQGRAYETRHVVRANLASGTPRILYLSDRVYGRIGTSPFFANIAGREGATVLPPDRMFDPLAIPPTSAQRFEDYMDDLLVREFEHFRARLAEIGISADVEVELQLDLMWIPGAKPGDFPVPVLVEGGIFPRDDYFSGARLARSEPEKIPPAPAQASPERFMGPLSFMEQADWEGGFEAAFSADPSLRTVLGAVAAAKAAGDRPYSMEAAGRSRFFTREGGAIVALDRATLAPAVLNGRPVRFVPEAAAPAAAPPAGARAASASSQETVLDLLQKRRMRKEAVAVLLAGHLAEYGRGAPLTVVKDLSTIPFDVSRPMEFDAYAAYLAASLVEISRTPAADGVTFRVEGDAVRLERFRLIEEAKALAASGVLVEATPVDPSTGRENREVRLGDPRFARAGKAYLPEAPFAAGEDADFQAFVYLAIFAGSVDPSSPPDSFVRAYRTVIGERLSEGLDGAVLKRFLSGDVSAPALALALKYALRPVEAVDWAGLIRFHDNVRRMVQRSA